MPRAVIAAVVGLLVLIPRAADAQSLDGSWESDAHRDAGRIHLQLRMDRGADSHWISGFDTDLAELSGLTADVARGSARDVEFRLEREAGSLVFRGDFVDGEGRGTFRFSASSDYLRAMAGLGYGDISDQRLLLFATLDVTTETVGEIQGLGYESLGMEDLVRFVIHGVSPEYIRQMNELGYADIRPEQLVKLRIHGVSPDYVRRMRAVLGR